MKLFIDPSNARLSTLGEFFKIPNVEHEKVWIDVSVTSQERSRWCWAAIAQALAAYYHQKQISQKQLVAELLDKPVFEPATEFEYDLDQANRNFKLDAVLRHVGCFGHWSPGKPLFERIQFEINQGHPLAARVEWYHGEAHYLLIHGYVAATQQILIIDPLHGAHQMPYQDFPRKYEGNGGTWTETFWTNKN